MTVRRKKTVLSEKGKYSILIDIPEFPECEHLTEFYSHLAEMLSSEARKCGCTCIVSYTVAYNSPELISLYTDIMLFRLGELEYIARLGDTRDKDGNMVKCPTSRRIKPWEWYFDGSKIYLVKYRFNKGDENGLRRSEYKKLIKTDEITPTSRSLQRFAAEPKASFVKKKIGSK